MLTKTDTFAHTHFPAYQQPFFCFYTDFSTFVTVNKKIMHNNYRSLWAVLVLFITTALVPAQKALGNPEALWKAVEHSDAANIPALLSQRAAPNSKTPTD